MERRFPAETVAKFLSQTTLLRECPAEVLLSIAQSAKQGLHKAREALLSAGRPPGGLGMLLKGRASLRVVNAATGVELALEELLPGDPFGEVGFLLQAGSPLAVVAEEDCATLTIEREGLEKLLRAHPTVGVALAKKISARFVQVSMLGLRNAPAMAARAGEVAAAPATATQPESGGALGKGELRFVDVASYNVNAKTLSVVPTRLILQHRMLPLQVRGKTLTIGMVNPRSVEALQQLKRTVSTLDPEVVAISADEFDQSVVRFKLQDGGDRKDHPAAARARSAGNLVYAADLQKKAEQTAKGQVVIGDEVIALLDRILIEAIERNVSDIHIEGEAAGLRVRYRTQGMLVDRQELVSSAFHQPLVARIKVLAELDITERRLPQDGRIVAQLGRRELNFRVSTLAAARGEKVVIRILDPASVMRPLGQIFTDPAVEKLVREMIAEPHGAVVVAGPTGSGKSSTLYSMLNERKTTRPDTNIVTVEDPVEYLLGGVTQVPVIPRVGLDFATVLRAMMRQDPDVIMVGELRDPATAGLAIEAALTGHLVLTSTHGNNATSVIQRLEHFGSNQMMLSQALNMILVQRLAPKLCPACAQDDEVAPALLENLVARHIVTRATTKLPRPVGCEACDKTGYAGRVAALEVLAFDDELRLALAGNMAAADLLTKARTKGRFFSFAQSAAYLMARRTLAPTDALLTVAV